VASCTKPPVQVDADPDCLSFLHAVRVIRRKLPSPSLFPLGRDRRFMTPCWPNWLWCPAVGDGRPAASNGRWASSTCGPVVIVERQSFEYRYGFELLVNGIEASLRALRSGTECRERPDAFRLRALGWRHKIQLANNGSERCEVGNSRFGREAVFTYPGSPVIFFIK